MSTQTKSKKKNPKTSQKEEVQSLLNTHLQFLLPILGEKKLEKRVKKASRIILEGVAEMKQVLAKTAKPKAKKAVTKKKTVPAKKAPAAKKVMAKKKSVKIVVTEPQNAAPTDKTALDQN